MDILSARKEDLAAVYALENKLFGEHSYPQFFIRQAYDCWGESLLVAKEGEAVAGYVLLTTSNVAKHYWIMSLAVNSEFRGRGIARSLVERVMTRTITWRERKSSFCQTERMSLLPQAFIKTDQTVNGSQAERIPSYIISQNFDCFRYVALMMQQKRGRTYFTCMLFLTAER
ncbi:acetyltransferase [Vibrio parahaemolyticus EN9701072]|nr:acetyltransferase [Vibrio parahaemolyticus EN9701072]